MGTLSYMLPLGTPAPDFSLTDVRTGNTVSLNDYKDAPALIVAFICNHCPYVKHVRDGWAALGNEYHKRGIGVVAICANDVENYPTDSPEAMKDEAADAGYEFPYLHDDSQSVALAYHAACTPDFFVFDGERKLVYRGQMDSSRRKNDIPVTGEDLRAAVEAILNGQPVSSEQIPSIGCGIKWKAGNEPQ